jgi:hypothetical protein
MRRMSEYIRTISTRSSPNCREGQVVSDCVGVLKHEVRAARIRSKLEVLAIQNKRDRVVPCPAEAVTTIEGVNEVGRQGCGIQWIGRAVRFVRSVPKQAQVR